MGRLRGIVGALLLLLGAAPGWAAGPVPASPAVTDPAPDAAAPARMEAFVMPAADPRGAMNAVLLLASGNGPHPALLLLHGFPGNEQNLDLAQAARRAGWHVLTLHYRGSWGSPGAFSFTHAAEDAHTALAWLRNPANAAKYGIDPARIAVAGHSMGAFMAADVAADDTRVVGLFVMDGWDIGGDAATIAQPAGRARWMERMADNMPPLQGTTLAGLADEVRANGGRFDLKARLLAFGKRPLAIYGASRANGASNLALLGAAIAAGNGAATGGVWATDHPFSDHRVALATTLVDWLATLEPRP